MKTVEEIRTSNSVDKTSEYKSLMNELLIKAHSLYGKNPFLGRFVEEMEIISNGSSDCEYTAYTNANAVEIWFNKLRGVVSGKLTLGDLLK